MQARIESGLSIRMYCIKEGLHENVYYYWQRKLREAVCGELSKKQEKVTSKVPSGFTEVKLAEHTELSPMTVVRQSEISIESSRVRITADSEYPLDKLIELLKAVSQQC